MLQPRSPLISRGVRRFLYLTVPTLAPVLILGIYSVVVTNASLRDQQARAHGAGLAQLADLLGFVNEHTDSLFLSFGMTPEVMMRVQQATAVPYSALDLDSIRMLRVAASFLDVAVNSRTYVHSIYVYYRNDYGQFLCSGRGVAFLDSYHDTAWHRTFAATPVPFRLHVENRAIVSFAGEPPTEVLTFYRNLFPTVGSHLGVIVVNLRRDYLRSLVERAFVSPQTCAFAVDRSGNLVLADNPLGLPEDDVLRLANAAHGFAEVTTSRGRAFVSTLPLEKYGWTLVAVSPSRDVRKVVRVVEVTVYALVLLALALGVVLAYVLHRRDSRHLRDMVAIVEAATRGDPPPAVDASTDDEFGYLLRGLLANFIQQDYLRLRLSEQSYQLKYSQLAALQSQINPHFLFNTLESINWAVQRLAARPTRVSRLISDLAGLLKYSLSSPDRLVTLQEEIASVGHYLDIQRHRYPRKVSVEWAVQDAALACRVPRLILQPLVENAIYHGIKEKAGRGRLEIRVDRDDGRVTLGVSDDGAGMSGERTREVLADIAREGGEPSGHGLENVARRLRLLFGEAASLHIESAPGRGTRVRVAFPADESDAPRGQPSPSP
jgi:two-component system, sensor histidine kinase YesM